MLKRLQRRSQRYIYLEQRTLQAAIVTYCKQCRTERGERLERFRNQEANDMFNYNYSISNNYRIL